MDYLREEKEVSIKELFFYIISKWRIFLLAICAVVLITVVVNVFPVIKYMEVLGVGTVIKALIKQIIVIFFIVAILLIVVYAFVFLFTDTIKSSHEFSSVCNIPIIGCVVKTNKKHNLKLDKAIKKINGIKYRLDEIDLHKQCIAKFVEKYVRTNTKDRNARVVIASSYSVEYAENIKSAINDNISNGIEFSVVGDINTYPDAIDKIENADYVLFVECQGKSKYRELEQLAIKIGRWKKEIIGVVLVEVDGI